jgi:FMN phosphatase YigB (HAD superfamily)
MIFFDLDGTLLDHDYAVGLSINTLVRQRRHKIAYSKPEGKGAEEKIAYMIGGSFVGYLIEKYGLSQFKDVYQNGDYSKIQGKTLAILENEWRASLQDT